jgi:hypothetical protein
VTAAKPYILGIDPGLSGALALLGDDHVEVFDMPTLEVTQGKKGKARRIIDLYTLARWVDVNSGGIKEAHIETPMSMPNDGAVQAHKFGFCCGAVQMAVASAFIPMHLVAPNTWKARMALSSSKDDSRAMASRLFPRFAHLFARKKDDGRAEAVLLARYGQAAGNNKSA